MQLLTEGVLLETIERAKRLKAKTPNVPDVHFQVLERGCNEELENIITKLNYLLSGRKYQDPKNQSVRLKEFKSVVRNFDVLENVGYAALTRCDTNDDVSMCRLIQKVCREINYPLQPPTVVCLSKDYYCIYPHLKLLCIPLLESDSLLHLPDLYHELGHPLITEENNPKVEPFREELGKLMVEVRKHFTNKIMYDIRNNNEENTRLFDHWMKSWMNWAIEFFCDIFAVCTLGSSFAWAHLYLSLKRGGNPFFVPIVGQVIDHPNDEARAMVIDMVLKGLGFNDKADEFMTKWDSYTRLTSYRVSDEFKHAFPNELLEKCAKAGIEATRSIKCRLVEPDNLGEAGTLLNEAWESFVTSANGYLQVENGILNRLKNNLS